jgi:hypothetical protein
MARKTNRPFTVRRVLAPEAMPPENLLAAERIFARLVARMYVAEHPHLFARPGNPVADHPKSGPPAAAAAVAGALPASVGGPALPEERREYAEKINPSD